jgi:hypothetical protein
MPDYIWTGKDKLGHSFVEQIEAPTAAQAAQESS